MRVADYGLQPGSGQDALPVIRRIIEENKGVRGLQIRFDKGRYDFYPDAERQAAGKPTTAFAFGAKADPLAMYLNDVCTIPSNLAGHPAVSVPFGVGDDGLPVGVQLMAPALGELVLLAAAAAVEAAAATQDRS